MLESYKLGFKRSNSRVAPIALSPTKKKKLHLRMTLLQKLLVKVKVKI